MSQKAKNILFFLVFVSGAFCLCSCASRPARETLPYVWLTNTSKFILLHPENIDKPLDGPQLISASFQGQNHQMLTWVKADETGINMVLLNEMGSSLGELSFQNGAVSFSSAVFPRSLRPEYIIADFQLCFYNAASLGKALQESGLSFQETENGRRVLQRNSAIIEIIFSPNIIKITNHLRGYTFTLEGDFS